MKATTRERVVKYTAFGIVFLFAFGTLVQLL